MKHNYRGSEWRIWDLHIHTPESICQEYINNNESWEKFILALENLPKEVKVIGITDYYFIDGFEKVFKYKREGRLKNIDKIFPILEFRIDTFGSGNENKLQKINLHILFDLDESKIEEEIKLVKEEFIDRINISPLDEHKTKKLSKDNFAKIGGTLKDGFNSLIPSTKEVLDTVKSQTWKAKTFLFLGYKEWSNLEKNQQLKPLKNFLYSEVKAFFSSNSETNEKNQVWLNEFGNKKLLHSLDIHSFKELDTYELDSDQNLKPSENYNCHTWIKADPTFNGLKQIGFEPEERVQISTLKPEEKPGYQAIDSVTIAHSDFTKQTLYLNQNLNSIIGGRSTGKSVLLGAIAKKLKCDKPVKFDNPDYADFVNSVVSSLSIIWKDGVENNDRNIEYFPQSYMYQLAKNKNGELDDLIDDIVRQSPEKNQKVVNYQSFSSDNNSDITSKVNKLFNLQESLENRKTDLKEKGDEKGITNEIEKLKAELSELKSKIRISEEELEEYNNYTMQLQTLQKSLEFFKEEITKIQSLKSKFFINKDIDYDLVSLNDRNREEIKNAFSKLKDEFQTKWFENLNMISKKNQIEFDKVTGEIEKIKLNKTYQKGLEAFKNNKQYKEVEEKLNIQRNKLTDIKNIKKEIDEYKLQIESFKTSIKQAHREFYNQIEEIKEDLKVSENKLEIVAFPKLNENRLRELLTWSINQQSDLGKSLVNFNFEKPEDFFELIEKIFERLITKRLTLKGENTHLSLALKLMSTNFFSISYDILYEDTFKQMSEGKKAFVVLMLLLDFSDKECPILIDQPEDDLDNRAIYADLVRYLKKKKKKRQIIVVTHNPNIVVGADSEQVIVANQNGIDTKNRNNIKFQYVSGSLENSKNRDESNEIILESQGIKEHVCEILEGGNEAFKQREMKYDLP
ncbi:TrlF family AAA-like ATPase [Salinimicrobium sp. WS361]|uniref:TrlF family AAA-like ATPase n=1 Tax=Salinimicrobium sp. WS361 TaxID=3425123 RepID=UPI003D6EDB17